MCTAVAAGNTIPMATTRSRKRWAVRLSVTRRGGQHAWGPISGDFERSLAAQAGSAVIQRRVDAQTRRDRTPPATFGPGGYTVIPRSNSMTSPPPRVDSRSVPVPRTLARAWAPVFFARPASPATSPRGGCCEIVGISVCALAACRHQDRLSSWLCAGERAGGLLSGWWSGAGSNRRPSAFQRVCPQ